LGGIGELARDALGSGGDARKAPPAATPQIRRGPFEGAAE
jgi:hypothetical protein